jgi:alpha-N-acetylglucosaminidase
MALLSTLHGLVLVAALDVVHSLASPAAPELAAAQQLVSRVLGTQHAAAFHLQLVDNRVNNGSYFELFDAPGRLVGIRGSSGVSLASGLHWYLKYSCNISIAYGSGPLDQRALPVVWPVAAAVRMMSPFEYRYYMNVVTHSYTAAFWGWPRWEKEIDFMAMMGINLPLAFTGQEFLWNRVYRERFNLSQASHSMSR